MTDPSILLPAAVLAGLTPVAAIAGLRNRDGGRWASELSPYRIQVSSTFEPSSLEQFLGTMTGLLPSQFQRLVSVRGIGMEVVGTNDGIDHVLLVPRHQEEIVLGQLRSSIPGTRATLDLDYRPTTPTLAGEFATSSSREELNVTDATAVATGILGALQPLDEGEQLIVQYLLLPSTHPGSMRSESGRSGFLDGLFSDPKKQPAAGPKPSHDKRRLPHFAATVRIGVRSRSPARDRQLLARLTASFHGANGQRATLRRRRVSSRQVARLLVTRRPPIFEHPCVLNSKELAGLLALPPKGVSLPGIRLSGSRQVAPSSDIARSGLIIADSNFEGASRPLAITVESSHQHVLITGPSGTGKSVLMDNLAIQAMQAGHTVIVIDPKRDLVTDLLDRIPEHRRDDVIVLDPMDERPVGLNVLQNDNDPDLVAEQVFAIIHKLNRDSWGPRLGDLLRASLHTLARTEDSTLCELPLLLTDPTFRQSVIGGLDDPIGLGAVWAGFDSWSEAERSQAVSPILNKVRPWVVRPRLRHILGQARPLLDMDDVLANKRILLVPLSAGDLGDDAAALLGAVVMAKVSQAVMRRVRLPQSERPPAFLFIDEAQMLEALPTPIPDLLAMARGMAVSVVMAHQTLSQFSPELREAVLGTARSRVTFQVAASDANRFAKDLSPYLKADDLKGLGAYEVVATLATAGRVAPPATGRTRPLPHSNGLSDQIRHQSSLRWGRAREDVEAELRRRQERPTPGGKVGRQRRSK